MFVKIGDIKLSKIQVVQNGNILYEGMVEDAPNEIKELEYTSANFQSGCIILEVPNS